MPEQVAFDHLIHWVDDFEEVMSAYDAHGLPTHVALTMPGFRNGAWGIDDERYVELATVDDWTEVRESKYADGLKILRPAIDALAGPGLLTFAVDVPDARSMAVRLRAAGRQVEELEVWFEDKGVGFVEVFVRDAPSYFPFFITYDPPRAEIAAMRAEYRQAKGISLAGGPDLVALLVRSPAPDSDALLLADLLDCPVDGARVALPGAEVRFESGEVAGLYGIVVRGLAPAEPVVIAGMTVVVEE